MKRFCAFMLSLIMVLGLFAGVSLKSEAAGIGESPDNPYLVYNYGNLKNALEDKTTVYIKVMEDFHYTIESAEQCHEETQISITRKKILDLNGKEIMVWNNENWFDQELDKISYTYSDFITVFGGKNQYGDLTIVDSAGGAVLKYDGAYLHSDDYDVKDYVTTIRVTGANAKLTVNGGSIKAGDQDRRWMSSSRCTNDNPLAFFNGYAYDFIGGAAIEANSGEVIINGGSFTGRPNVKSKCETFGGSVNLVTKSSDSLKVTINSGEFDGRCGADALYIDGDVDLTIRAGIFDVHTLDHLVKPWQTDFVFEPGYGSAFVPAGAINFNLSTVLVNGEDLGEKASEYGYSAYKTRQLYMEYEGTSKRIEIIPRELNGDEYNKYDSSYEYGAEFYMIADDDGMTPADKKARYNEGKHLTFYARVKKPYFEQTPFNTDPSQGAVHYYATFWEISGDGKSVWIGGGMNLDLDNLPKDLTWNNGEPVSFEMGETYKVYCTIVEYLSTTYEVYAIHSISDYFYLGKETIYEVDIKLGNLEEGLTPTVSVDEEAGYTIEYSVFYDPAVFVYEDPICGMIKLKPKKGYSFADNIQLEFETNDRVTISYSKNERHHFSAQDITLSRYWITLHNQFLGSVSLGDVYTRYATYWNVNTEVRSDLLEYTFEVDDSERGGTYFAAWESSPVAAFEKMLVTFGEEELVGKNIRMLVRAEGYIGTIASPYRTMQKTPTTEAPVKPELSVTGSGKEWSVSVTNYQEDQDYFYSTSLLDTSKLKESDWKKNTITSGEEISVSSGLIYVYTRIRENEYYQSSSTVYYTGSYAGSSVAAKGIIMTEDTKNMEVGGFATLYASLYPAEQTDSNPAYIKWYVSGGDKNCVKPRVDGKTVEWPTDGGYITGSSLTLEGMEQGSVELTASITLPGNNFVRAACRVYVAERGEVLITGITQPEDVIYIYPGSDYFMEEFTVTPAAADSTARRNAVWKISRYDGDMTGISIRENGWISVDEQTEEGTTFWVYPDISGCYGNTDFGYPAPVAERCVMVVPVPPDVEVGTKSVRARSGARYEIATATYGEGDLTFESSDESVATVNEDGVVEMQGEGQATITVSYGDDSETVQVKVLDCEHEKNCTDNGDGTHTWTCSKCRKSGSEEHSYGVTYSDENGKHFHNCSCGYTEEVAEEHTLSDVVTVSPGYGTEGVLSHVCDLCSYAESETIAARVHIHNYDTGDRNAETDESLAKAADGGASADYCTDYVYDATAHWIGCIDIDCPDYEGSKQLYGNHTLTETTVSSEDGTTVTIKNCSVCGYREGGETSELPKKQKAYALAMKTANTNPGSYLIAPVVNTNTDTKGNASTDQKNEASTGTETTTGTITAPETKTGAGLVALRVILGMAALGITGAGAGVVLRMKRR